MIGSTNSDDIEALAQSNQSITPTQLASPCQDPHGGPENGSTAGSDPFTNGHSLAVRNLQPSYRLSSLT